MKRIATMQDVSCVGKCSLTVALPILSAMGIETAVIPTAMLSTHTMFEDFTFHDLTGEIRPVMDHWHKEGFDFDALYTGYLGSLDQIQLAHELFTEFGKDSLVLVDPCMADNGALYPGFTKEFAMTMRNLCKDADILCPNLTEASIMLEEPYKPEGYTEEEIHHLLRKLTDLGAEKAVITGVSHTKGQLGASFYDKKEDRFFHYETKEQPGRFHGTGDIFASVLLGGLVNGLSFEDALKLACDYVSYTIGVTLKDPDHRNYGVNFEASLPKLIDMLKTC